MTCALLLDIDGTLTPARKELRREMAEALINLSIPFHVAAGSDLPLLKDQFFRPLFDFGFRRDFEAYVSNGSAHYVCAFSRGFEFDLVDTFDFREHLGEENYVFLLQVLKDALEHEAYKLPETQIIVGKHIIDRHSMLNFAPIGRPEGLLSEDAQLARERFKRLDEDTNYRLRLHEHLSSELGTLCEEKGLHIMYGGETSFDIVIRGQDKTRAARSLLDKGIEKVVFIGDALFDGGNDSVIRTMIAEWNHDEGPCPIEEIEVTSWNHTIAVFRDRGWLASEPNSETQ